MAHRVVGIDFGHDRIRGAEVEDPGTRRERVLRQGTVPLSPDAVVSGEVRDVTAVTAALKQLWQQTGFRSRRVVLGLGNARVLARDLEVPVRPRQQIREQLPFLVADLLPMPLENAVLDYYPVREFTDEHGVEMYAGILVVALKDVAMTNARAAAQAGLEVVGIDMIAFALVRHVAEPAVTEPVAHVHVGATTTIITVAIGQTPVFSRIVPAGGEEVTRSLVELGQLSREQAEQVKATIGLSAEGVEPRYRPVVELMVTRTSELMTAIRDTITYFVDTHGEGIARIVLSGGGAGLGGFAPMVAAWTRIPAERWASDSEYLVATALAGGARQSVTRRAARSGESASGGEAGSAATPPPTQPIPAPPVVPVPAGGPTPEPVPTTTAPAPILSVPEDAPPPAPTTAASPPAAPTPPTSTASAPASGPDTDSGTPDPGARLGLPGGIAPTAPPGPRKPPRWARSRNRGER